MYQHHLAEKSAIYLNISTIMTLLTLPLHVHIITRIGQMFGGMVGQWRTQRRGVELPWWQGGCSFYKPVYAPNISLKLFINRLLSVRTR
jgi:hypothetical protein